MLPRTTHKNQSRQLNAYRRALQRLATDKHREQGFTLIESLMAIIIITITLVAITPPIFLSVATRVQNQKAEQAMQLAQRETDKIRVLIERADYTTDELPPQATPATANAKDVPAPNPNFPATCPSPIAFDLACPVDVNGDSKPDFYLQTYRTRQFTSGISAIPVAFDMGVRVYAASAKDQPSLQTEQASLKFTTGQGIQRSRPLAVMYTQIVRSDQRDSLLKYRDFLNQPTP